MKIFYTSENGNSKKNFCIFSKVSCSYICETETLKKLLIFQETEAPKKRLIFQEVKSNCLVSSLEKLVILQYKLSKPENQTRNYSLALLIYQYIDSSLAISLSITHPVVDTQQNFEDLLQVKRNENIIASGNKITLKRESIRDFIKNFLYL